MNLAEIRHTLITSPDRSFLVEMLNSAQINPIYKGLAFTAIQNLTEDDVAKYSRIAAVAIQYLEQGDLSGLKTLLDRSGVPAPFIALITNYASHFISVQ